MKELNLILERIKVQTMQRYPKECVADMHTAILDDTRDFVLQIEREVWTHKQEAFKTVTWETPASLWDEWKEKHLPEFLLKHFPVEYKTRKKEFLFTELHKFPEFPPVPEKYGSVILERQIHDPGDKCVF